MRKYLGNLYLNYKQFKFNEYYKRHEDCIGQFIAALFYIFIGSCIIGLFFLIKTCDDKRINERIQSNIEIERIKKTETNLIIERLQLRFPNEANKILLKIKENKLDEN